MIVQEGNCLQAQSVYTSMAPREISMKHITFIIVLFATLGCERITSKDGSIPLQYLSTAEKYMGDYKGVFGNKSGVLSLRLNGNKPVLTFLADSGETDLLDSRCRSSIGHLSAIDPQKLDNELRVDTAEFLIQGGKCPLVENYILLDFKHSGSQVSRVRLTLFEKYETEMRTICFPDGSGRQHCRTETWQVPSYILGSFDRL